MKENAIYFNSISELRNSLKKDLQLYILAYTLVNNNARYSDIMRDIGDYTNFKENTIRSSLNTLMNKNLLKKVERSGDNSPIYVNNFNLKNNYELYNHPVSKTYLNKNNRLELSEKDFRPTTNEQALKSFLMIDGFLSALISAYSISDTKIMKEIAVFKEMLDNKIKEDLEKNDISLE